MADSKISGLTESLVANANQEVPINDSGATRKIKLGNLLGAIRPNLIADAATTGPLPSNTYLNGTAGVGATLIATANGALSVDGVTLAVGMNVLVKDEAVQANNGLYSVTQVGDATHPYVLTRSVYMNTASQFGSSVVVVKVTSAVNGNSVWSCYIDNPTVGTTAIAFSQMVAALNIDGTTLVKANGIISVNIDGTTIQLVNGKVTAVFPSAATATPAMDGVGAAGTSTSYARQDHVHPTDTSRAPLASPAFTGTPTTPQPAADDNSTKIANTEWFMGQAGTTSPNMDGVAAAGTATRWSRSDHVHPTDTSRYAASNPAGYVDAAGAAAAAPVQSVAARTGAVTLSHTDITDWSTATSNFGSQISVGGTPPTSPKTGQEWWNSTNGKTYIYTGTAWAESVNENMALGSTATPGALQVGAGLSVNSSGVVSSNGNDVGRNKIDNSLFLFWQRGIGSSPFTGSAYTADRWVQLVSTSSMSTSRYGITSADAAQIGDEEALYALQSVVTGTAGAGDFAMLVQRIEQARRLSNKTVTVSFYAKATSGTPKLGVSIDQSFGTGGSPSAQVNGTGQAVTLSTSWTRYSLTFAIPSVSGMTFGTNNDDYTALDFWFSSGSTNNTRAGNIGSQSATFQLWGVQLEIGSTATPLEKLPWQMDFARCLRFYQVGSFNFSGYGAAGGTSAIVTGALLSPMRVTPTVTPSYSLTQNCSGVFAMYTSTYYYVEALNGVGNFQVQGTFTASADL